MCNGQLKMYHNEKRERAYTHKVWSIYKHICMEPAGSTRTKQHVICLFCVSVLSARMDFLKLLLLQMARLPLLLRFFAFSGTINLF